MATILSCNNPVPANKNDAADSAAKSTFGSDLAFLQKHDSVVLLTADGEAAKVIVSPKYQGKVFTSTADGASSFGWINYKAFTAPVDAHMNAYGGENRFWLGPEGGPFSLYFAKGKQMVFDNWKTPPAIDTEPWTVTTKSAAFVSMQKEMKLVNYAGTELSILAGRDVTILPKSRIANLIGAEPGSGVKAVGYLASNSITNKGDKAWNEATGAPCIWMLDMFNPSAKTTVVVPYKNGGDTTTKVATTDYFGQIPADRVRWSDDVLYFKADGKSRGKLGLAPDRAKPVAGSWDAENGVLTITLFDVDATGKYLNQEWKTTQPPFSGDAVNAYNDGPLEDGSQMGPFYEIESVSPAALLKPGAVLTHNHHVFHFTGDKPQLDAIAKKVLGISLAEIEKAF